MNARRIDGTRFATLCWTRGESDEGGDAMRTIEATVVVGPDRCVSIRLPADIAEGPRRVVVVIDDAPAAPAADLVSQLPQWDFGAWPEGWTARREEIYDDDGR